jgi:hypothetical protein
MKQLNKTAYNFSVSLKVGYSRICACAGLLFMWGHTGSCHPLFVLGPVSFLAITRSLFLSQVNWIAQGLKEWISFQNILSFFWATIRQITSYWGNMTNRKGYYASRDASKVYQSVSIWLFYCFPRWKARSISASAQWWYTYILKLLPKVVKKRIQEGLEIAPNIAAMLTLQRNRWNCCWSPSIEVLMTIKFSLLHYFTIVYIYELFYLFYLQTETHNIIIKA